MEKRKAYTAIGLLCLIIVALLFASTSLGYFLLVSRNEIAFQELTIGDLSEQFLSLQNDLEKRVRFLDCSDSAPFDPDYSGNREISNSLKDWVEEESESVDETSWDVIWNNSNPTMHRLDGEYSHYFLVFFDDTEDDYTNGVFWLSGQCWLDLPMNDEGLIGNR